MSDREAEAAIAEALYLWDDTGFQQTGYSTEDYLLAVGMPQEVNNSEGFQRLGYCVVNRRFGVVEYQDFILASAIRVMNQLQKAMEGINGDIGQRELEEHTGALQ